MLCTRFPHLGPHRRPLRPPHLPSHRHDLAHRCNPELRRHHLSRCTCRCTVHSRYYRSELFPHCSGLSQRFHATRLERNRNRCDVHSISCRWNIRASHSPSDHRALGVALGVWCERTGPVHLRRSHCGPHAGPHHSHSIQFAYRSIHQGRCSLNHPNHSAALQCAHHPIIGLRSHVHGARAASCESRIFSLGCTHPAACWLAGYVCGTCGREAITAIQHNHPRSRGISTGRCGAHPRSVYAHIHHRNRCRQPCLRHWRCYRRSHHDHIIWAGRRTKSCHRHGH